MNKFTDPLVAYDFIKRTSRDLADMITKLDDIKTQFKWCSEAQEWDPLVEIELDEAASKLGTALATFVTWYEPHEEALLFQERIQKNVDTKTTIIDTIKQ